MAVRGGHRVVRPYHARCATRSGDRCGGVQHVGVVGRRAVVVGVTAPRTVSALLGAALADIGVRRIFGAPTGTIAGIDGLAHVRIDEPVLAAALAGAAGRVGPGPGAALLPDRRLVVTATGGLPARQVVVSDPGQMVELVAAWDRLDGVPALDLVLDVDLDAPAPDDAAVLRVTDAGAGMTLGPDLRSVGVVVLAGPGVRRAGRVGDLLGVARSGGMAVAVTVGAAGLLAADDPWYAGVVGLQERDSAAAGLPAAPVVVVTGVDPTELPGDDDPALWGAAQVLEVAPSQLATLGLRFGGPDPQPPPPSGLAAAVAAACDAVDAGGDPGRSPAAACRALARLARRDAVVAADAGPAGLWLARVATTAVPGAVVLPSMATPGFAVAAAMVAALDSRPATAVVVDPPDPVTAALVELAASWHLDMVLASWGGGDAVAGAGRDAAGATERWGTALRAAARDGGLAEVALEVDPAATRHLIEHLGPVTGWQPAR
jgi:hypothetical protein